MAWVAAPSPAAQAYGHNGPNTGLIQFSVRGTVAEQPPTPPWKAAPAATSLINPNATTSYST